MRQKWMTWQFPDRNRKWFINTDLCSPTLSMPCKLAFLLSGEKNLSVRVWMNSNPALTLLNINLSFWRLSKCRRTNFFASGFRIASSTKSRMSIRSLEFWSSLRKVLFLVWAETSEGTQYSETALWVNANFGRVGFIYLYKYFTCRRDSRLMHWPNPFFCFPCHIHMPHLDLSAGFKEPEISAVGGLENGHVLIFYSFCACVSKPLQSVAFSEGQFRVGF